MFFSYNLHFLLFAKNLGELTQMKYLCKDIPEAQRAHFLLDERSENKGKRNLKCCWRLGGQGLFKPCTNLLV
jgi:hypothetical protein